MNRNQIMFGKEEYKNFLKRHDMIFEKPAAQWDQGVPMGNGLLGTMVWGGGDRPIKISLDRADIWELRNITPDYDGEFNWKTFTGYLKNQDKDKLNTFLLQDRNKPHPTRFPVGRLEFTTKGKVVNHTMRFHLSDAVTTGRTETELGAVKWKTWVSVTNQVVVMETWSEGGESFTMRPKFISRPGDYTDEDTTESTRWEAYGGRRGGKPHTVTDLLKAWGYSDSKEGETNGVHWWSQAIPENGGYAAAWKSVSVGLGHDILLVTISCDRKDPDPSAQAVAVLADMNALDVYALLDEHLAWWMEYYSASFFSIPDTRLEALYYIELYKLASSTRPGGMHMTLQGPWSEDDNLIAYCSNDYHWNLEQQMQLWPIYTSNRLDFGMPMYDMIDNSRPILREFCKKFFGREGEFIAHCTDLDCRPLMCNIDNFEFNGLPWVCFMYWQHYLYSMDENFLRERAYPLMRETLRPLMEELEEGPDGYLHLPWSSSPEYHSPQETYRWVRHEEPDWTNRFGPDATIDLSLIRFLCKALIKASDILKVDDEERSAWENTLAHLTPYHRDEFGGLAVRAGLPLTTSHRHQSHLFPIYPLHEMTMETDAETIDRCLTVLGINGRGEWTGWSFPWVALLGAYGGRTAMARNTLLDYADRYVTESTMHGQGPQKGCDISLYGYPGGNFSQTVEAGFGAIAALQELAIQSVGGIVRLFENTPPAWADISLWNMRTEGAFLVSAVRKTYITQFVHVFAEHGGKFVLRTNFGCDTVHVERGGQTKDCTMTDGSLTIDMEKGDELVIWTGETKPEILVKPLEGVPADYNFYGVKTVSRF